MAGTNPAFNADFFRESIRNTMIMGLPNNPMDQVIFHFPKVKTYDPPDAVLDEDGQPFDPTVDVIYVAPDPISVPCAVEFAPVTMREDEQVGVGVFRTTRVILTLLDTEFAQVSGATEATIGGDLYNIAYEIPPVGLFDVTVHQFMCFAKDEK